MMRRIEEAAGKRVALLIDGLCEAIAADLPPGVQAEPVDDGVALSGRGLARALASLLAAVVVNLVLATNHKPGRYMGMS